MTSSYCSTLKSVYFRIIMLFKASFKCVVLVYTLICDTKWRSNIFYIDVFRVILMQRYFLQIGLVPQVWFTMKPNLKPWISATYQNSLCHSNIRNELSNTIFQLKCTFNHNVSPKQIKCINKTRLIQLRTLSNSNYSNCGDSIAHILL